MMEFGAGAAPARGTEPPGQGAQGASDQPKDKAGQAADQAKEKAGQAADQAKGRAREQVDQRSTQAGEQVHSMAEALRSTGDKLREEGNEQPAKAADRAAEQAQKVGGYLVDSDADRILGDVEDFARKQPLAVLAGGVALGFVAARFLKASSQSRASQRSGSDGSSTSNGYSGTYGDTPPRAALDTPGLSARPPASVPPVGGAPGSPVPPPVPPAGA